MANGKRQQREGDGTPPQDPTALTTQALIREIEGLREFQDLRIDTARDTLSELFKMRIEALNEKVTQQFELVERQRVEQKKDTKDAVDAALTAQKEAVQEQTTASDRAIAKSEAATTRQLEQLTITFNNGINSLTQRLDEVKERLNQVDNRDSVQVGARGQTLESRQQSQWGTGTIIAVAGVLLAFMGIAVTVVIAAVAFAASQ